MSGEDCLVWYAVYGSNLLRERFRTYLEGGSFPPNPRIHPRCPTGATIGDDRPFQLQFELCFAHESDDWKGGVAFVGIERDVRHRTLGRAYLLRLSQLIHIARGENGASGIIRISRESLSREPSNIRDKGWYRVLLPCASINGVPVVTLTGRPEETYPRNSPSDAYRNTIRQGLRETYSCMSDTAIDEYLQRAIAR